VLHTTSNDRNKIKIMAVIYLIRMKKGIAMPCLFSNYRNVYPLHFKMQISASRERVSYKALIEENSYSIIEINNAGDDPLSACP
jgi:hypothetical protein